MRDVAPLVFNPRAQGGGGERLARKAARLLEARGVSVEPTPTLARGEARDLAQRLADEGAPLVLACGGDGTISEVADGILRSGKPCAAGFLPAGTGNSFLRHFGLTTMPDAARRIASGAHRTIDAGLVRWSGGERHFVNVFGVGFIAHVARLADARFKLFGAGAYTLAVFPEVARLRAPRTRLVLDGEELDERFVLVAVCNTIHTGGGMLIAPNASAQDGWFDVVALRRVGRVALLRMFPLIFSGKHVGHPLVVHRRARNVRIEPDDASPLLADGEIFGTTPVDVQMIPHALRILA